MQQNHPKSSKPSLASETICLVKIVSSSLKQAIKCRGTTISISNGNSPLAAFAISKNGQSDDGELSLISSRLSGSTNIDEHDCIIFPFESYSVQYDIKLANEQCGQNLDGRLNLNEITPSKTWIDHKVTLQGQDSNEVELIGLKIVSLPRDTFKRHLPTEDTPSIHQTARTCEPSRVESCDECCLLQFIYQDSPFRRANECECDFILIPRRGNFLDDFDSSSELHIGIACFGSVKEFNHSGLKCTRSAAEMVWDQCLPLRVIDRVQSLASSPSPDPSALWVRLFDKYARIDDPRWTAGTYDGENNNCFDFALEFLHRFNDAIDRGGLGSSDSRQLSKVDLCQSFVLPSTREAARYIDTYRRIWKRR